MRFAKITQLTMYLNQSSSYYSSGVYYYSTSNPTPTAHVTVRRNRLKLYGENVYMKDGTSFEIELWNPRSNRVLAKISINGVSVSGGGIVVNPGQRGYLERFLEEDRKFKFTTYEAENSAEGRAAIAKNGLVTVEFYDEIVQPKNWFCGNGSITINGPTICGGTTGNPTVNPTFTSDHCYFNSTPSAGLGDNIGMSANYSANMNLACEDSFSDKIPIGLKLTKSSLNIETGRIEKGERSNQKLVDTYGDFSFYACAYYTVKILPESQKPAEIGEIRSYCTGCGRRWRSGEAFCPTCGTARNN